MEDLDFGLLVGKTLTNIENSGTEIIFSCLDGLKYKLWHDQDCCESVAVDDVIGDIGDLIGTPILTASEDTSTYNPEGVEIEGQDSFTWTFYNLSTIKGHVTIRWYGSSNGYYSESVCFCKLQY